jgi:cell division protein FtsB
MVQARCINGPHFINGQVQDMVMKFKFVILGLFLVSQTVLAQTSESSHLAMLKAKNAQLENTNRDLEKRIKVLEDDRVRWIKLEETATRALNSAAAAQVSANNAKASADVAHHSYTNVSHAALRGFHGGCVPHESSGANCMAAAHRYCNSLGFAAGLVQEVGGDAYGVACFR